jgi:single-stranded-DNA-specific exonuclease
MHEGGIRKRWRLAEPGNDASLPRTLAANIRIHPLVAELLLLRGVTDTDQAQAFLDPKLNHLHDPSLVPGMTQAAQRLAQAVADSQPIVIYGDYDVDGVTASSILWHMLRSAGAKVYSYVPHRVDEGYGLNSEAIDRIARGQLDDMITAGDTTPPLIISVDCGITATEPALVAKHLGVDLIITDHHHFDPNQLPDAHTLVHPGLPTGATEPYPCPHLCGAGVAFKLAWQFARVHFNSHRLPAPVRDLLMDLLSFAALGTVADIVPLVGENRVLTIFGLSRIKHTRFVGLNALIDASRLRDEKIDAYHVGFVLGPRLNACGRMGHAQDAVRLLTQANAEEAATIARYLTAENDRRRATEKAIVIEARQMVQQAKYDHPDCRAIVLGKEGWHVGVVGIVASRLVDEFARPTVILSYDNGTAQGSARSVDGVSIHDAFAACSAHLERFGGHAMAAGVTLQTRAVDAFRASLVQHVNARLAAEDLLGVIDVDGALPLADCTADLFAQIQRLAPFGRGNPKPMLLLRNVILDQPATRIGRKGDHLTLMLRQDRQILRAVAFGMGDLVDRLPGGAKIDLVFEPRVSLWRGQRRPEIHVVDLRCL